MQRSSASLPLLVIPDGGIKSVVLARLTAPQFVMYESAWSLGAKLAAANALNAIEVTTLLGVSLNSTFLPRPVAVTRTSKLLAKQLNFPEKQINVAFLGGVYGALAPYMSNRLRLCSTCSRNGHHFIIHQIRLLQRCPLHDQVLRENCVHCGETLPYGMVFVTMPVAPSMTLLRLCFDHLRYGG
jgi:hypothetical protein